jgi:hypothetical protein
MTTLIWKRGKEEIKIQTLAQLLDLLIKIPVEHIDQEVTNNIVKGSFKHWLEYTYTGEVMLIAKLKKVAQEYTPQQLREFLIRELKSMDLQP